MKRIIGVTIIVTVFVLAMPAIYSLDFLEKGFYAEYRMYEDPETPHPSAFALLREHKEWDIKYLYIEDMIYKYQILDIQDNIVDIRVCFEGKLNAGGYELSNYIFLSFKRIFDIKLNLDTLEMVDENGNAWGKWLFWIKPGSYDWREYTLMKNWNNHGKVKAWLKGPLENENLSSFLKSPHAENIKHYFVLTTTIRKKNTFIYPLFEDYGIMSSYNVQITEEGTVSGRSGSYYLSTFSTTTSEGEIVEMEPGLFVECYYTDDGMLFEDNDLYYMDDFIGQKLGIIVLQLGGPLVLTDYGVKDEIVIEDPTPETQRTSFEEEVEMMVGKNGSEETPQEKSETPQKTEQKSELKSTSEKLSETPATPRSDKDNEMLYYIVPLLVVMLIAVFLVLKEKR